MTENKRETVQLIAPTRIAGTMHEAGNFVEVYPFEKRNLIAGGYVKGAAEKAWATLFETDYGLRWDPRRECWVDSDGHAYDGSGFGAQNRRPSAVREQG